MHNSIISVILFVGLLYGPSVNAASIEFQSNMPDRYVVVPGDTLWGLASRFLKDPWRWPEIWGLNQKQIKNPHKIYPGDLIVLEKTPDGSRLRLVRETIVERSSPLVERLSPLVRVEKSDLGAIPSIPVAAIEPFLSQPLVIDKNGLENAPLVLGISDNRVILSKGDLVYAKDMPKDKGSSWQIFRPGKALIDPDPETALTEFLGQTGYDNGEVLGYEAIYLGDAKVEKFDDVSTISIVRSVQEIFQGDRLVLAPPTMFANYAPHAPSKDIKGRIISVYGGVTEFGKGSIVVLSKGTHDGLETGNVLAVYRTNQSKTSDGSQAISRNMEFGSSKREAIELPDSRAGLVFVFRVFERVSYALVMQTTQPLKIFDSVQTP
ncbi:MAG: LysM peptidoglycan-binding domain-containing protein [Nitrosomonadaceae bacterium]